MRTLKFIVEGQIIKQDPSCDFTNLVPGTEGYLRAEFSFSPEWNGCVKVASFWSAVGDEYPPQVLSDGVSCLIPDEATQRYAFKVGVIGKSNTVRLVTNKAIVKQNGGVT